MKRRLLVLTLAISVLPLGVSAGRSGASEVAEKFSERSPLRQILDEADPTNLQSCESMGKISVVYETGNAGPPSVGLRITDPRGRKIGYDPRVPKVWQELSLTEGFVECEQNDDTTLLDHCVAHIQICGPISGTYKLEVLPTQNASYSIGVVGMSQSTEDEIGFHSTDSRADYRGEIQQEEPETLMLNYSRRSGAQIKLGRTDPDVATWLKPYPSRNLRFLRKLTASGEYGCVPNARFIASQKARGIARHAQILCRQKEAAQDDNFVGTGETPVVHCCKNPRRTGMSALHFYEHPLVLPQLPQR